MLSNTDVEQLAQRMDVPLAFVGFKDDLPKTIKPNKYYMINLEDEFGSDGERNGGSHWTGFIVRKNGNGRVQPVYFDSYGSAPPKVVSKRIEDNFHRKVDYTTKDIQSLVNDMCGWYQLAWAHFCFGQFSTHDLYQDTDNFLSFFEDLEHCNDFKKNEFILKHFFRAKDPALQKEIPYFPDDTRVDNGNTPNFDKYTKDLKGMKIPVQADYKYNDT